MNFIEAVKLGVENGKKIKRDYWTCLYISFVDYGNELVINTGKESREKYIPTTTDIIANDWEIYEEKPKNVNFQEAFEALQRGHQIERTVTGVKFKRNKIMNGTDKIFTYRSGQTHIEGFYEDIVHPLFSYSDLLATDWIITESAK